MTKTVSVLMILALCIKPHLAFAQSCGTMKNFYTGESAAFDAVVDLQKIVYCLSNKNLSYINEINSNLFQLERDVDKLDQKVGKLNTAMSGDADYAKQNPLVAGQFQEIREAIAEIKGRLIELELSND